jgi:hypothetical protein
MPFFTLPYVSNPHENASFSQLYQEAFTASVRQMLVQLSTSAVEARRNQPLRLLQWMNESKLCVEMLALLDKASKGSLIPRATVDDLAVRLSAFTSAPRPSVALVPLDFEKLHNLFRRGLEAPVAYTLQALRWRLLRASSPKMRREVLYSYIQGDVLGCQVKTDKRRLVIDLLRSVSGMLLDSLVRFINVLASSSVARSYLLFSMKSTGTGAALPIVVELCRVIKGCGNESALMRNALGALQKFSLRKRAQSEMVRRDMVKWLCEVLKNVDALSEYCVEYATALLMNLALRKDGRKKCAEAVDTVISVLMDLLEYDSDNVKTYVNGVLYSLLTVPVIQEHAREVGLNELLRLLIAKTEDPIKQQLTYVQMQLDAETKPEKEDEDEAAEDEDDVEDEDEEEDMNEEFDDEEEEALPRPLATSNQLQGEELLSTEFLGTAQPPSPSPRQLTVRSSSNTSVTAGAAVRASSDRPPMRPATPRVQQSEPVPSRKAMEKVEQLRAKGEVRAEGDPIQEYSSAFGTRTRIPRTPASEHASLGL